MNREILISIEHSQIIGLVLSNLCDSVDNSKINFSNFYEHEEDHTCIVIFAGKTLPITHWGKECGF